MTEDNDMQRMLNEANKHSWCMTSDGSDAPLMITTLDAATGKKGSSVGMLELQPKPTMPNITGDVSHKADTSHQQTKLPKNIFELLELAKNKRMESQQASSSGPSSVESSVTSTQVAQEVSSGTKKQSKPKPHEPCVTMDTLLDKLKEMQSQLQVMQETEKYRNLYIVRFMEGLKESLGIDQEDPDKLDKECMRREINSGLKQKWLKKGTNLEKQICKENNATINGKDYAVEETHSSSDDDSSSSSSSDDERDQAQQPPPTPVMVQSGGKSSKKRKGKQVHFQQDANGSQAGPSSSSSSVGTHIINAQPPVVLTPEKAHSKRKTNKRRKKGYNQAMEQETSNQQSGGPSGSNASSNQPSTNENGNQGTGTAGLKSQDGTNLNIVQAQNVSSSEERQRKKLEKMEKIVKQREWEAKQQAYGGNPYDNYQMRSKGFRGGGSDSGGGYQQRSGGGGYQQRGGGGGGYGGGGGRSFYNNNDYEF
jgi:hypothetical protein